MWMPWRCSYSGTRANAAYAPNRRYRKGNQGTGATTVAATRPDSTRWRNRSSTNTPWCGCTAFGYRLVKTSKWIARVASGSRSRLTPAPLDVDAETVVVGTPRLVSAARTTDVFATVTTRPPRAPLTQADRLCRNDATDCRAVSVARVR